MNLPVAFFVSLCKTTVNPWLAGAALRIALVLYSALHDNYITPPFTDIDYHVALSGAEQLAAGKSPYDAATYRYSPVLAYVMLPSVLLHQSTGKVVFSVADLLCAAVVEAMAVRIGANERELQWVHAAWLYNPMIAILSARGSSDALLVALPVLALLYLLTSPQSNLSSSTLLLVGCLQGSAVHLKIVPIIFTPSIITYIWTLSPSWRFFAARAMLYGLAMLSSLAVITYYYYTL